MEHTTYGGEIEGLINPENRQRISDFLDEEMRLLKASKEQTIRDKKTGRFNRYRTGIVENTKRIFNIFQPKKSQENKVGGAKSKKNSKKAAPKKKSSSKPAATGKVHTGPRGGKYVIRGGRKVYL
jgi:hypothetical protein